VTGPRGAANPPARGGAPTPAASFVAGTASVYAISSDGRLHRLNVSTGDNIVQPVQVVPANARTSNLMMVNNTIYAVTSPACNLTQNAVWAIDLTVDPPKATSFALRADEIAGTAGPVIGTDGTVYVQTSGRLLALNAGDLTLRKEFNPENKFTYDGVNPMPPLVFQFKGRELIAAALKDGRLSLLDSNAGTSALVETPLSISGGLSTWQDADGTRWVLAPVWGRNGSSPNGSISAFKVEEQSGKTVLTPAWVSRDMTSPLPPVIASGVVFALSAGKSGTRATLYALDAATGKELYSSRNLIAAPASLAGMTVSNGRIYFSTLDGTFYGFGMFMEH
jgi:outer membrane protein assembly factor BamB